MKVVVGVLIGLLVGFIIGVKLATASATHQDHILEATKVRGNHFEAAWFEREVHSTVARTFLLKVRLKNEPRWIERALFSRITANGYQGMPVLRWKEDILLVEYEKADIKWFFNSYSSLSNPLIEMEVVLVKRPHQ